MAVAPKNLGRDGGDLCPALCREEEDEEVEVVEAIDGARCCGTGPMVARQRLLTGIS